MLGLKNHFIIGGVIIVVTRTTTTIMANISWLSNFAFKPIVAMIRATSPRDTMAEPIPSELFQLNPAAFAPRDAPINFVKIAKILKITIIPKLSVIPENSSSDSDRCKEYRNKDRITNCFNLFKNFMFKGRYTNSNTSYICPNNGSDPCVFS